MNILYFVGVNPERSLPEVGVHASSNMLTATYLAAANGNLECLRTLLQNGYHGTPSPGGSALHGAALSGHADCLQLLLDYNGL